MINRNRIINEFINLTKYDSISFQELDISLYLIDKLKSLGLEVSIDDIGHKLNDNPKATGNIYAYLKGDLEGSILFSAHMDTVSPGINKKAIIEGNTIKSDGTTVLGADDLSGIVSIIEMLTVIKEKNLHHPDIEIIFFIAEEPYCRGSKYFDFNKIKSKIAYVFDLDGKIGTLAVSAPSIIKFKAEIKGISAHSGFEADKGINSILVTSNIISKLKLGKIDDESTRNIGIINGGISTNIIPDLTTFEGEVRSLNNDKALSLINEIENIIKEETNKFNVSYEFNYEIKIHAYKIDENEYVLKRALKALNELNIKPNIINTFGGSDNNTLNEHNIKGIVVSNAMNLVHTTNEYLLIDEFEKSAQLCLKLSTIGW